MQKNRMVSGLWMTVFLMPLFLSLTCANFVCAEEEFCRYCGMKRSQYGHSWMIVTYGDNEECGFCSVHCAAVDMAVHIDRPLNGVTVGDYDSKKQIDAEKASWVIGGDKQGVMTLRAKWAFETKNAAEMFVSKHGGRLAGFEDAMRAAFEDMYEDIRMIRKKREMRRMKRSRLGE